MIKKLTIELEILPIDQLVPTERPQEIWARDLTISYSNWERIKVWTQPRFLGTEWEVVWSPSGTSDIKYQERGKMPYTHYMILPNIQIPAT